MSNCGSISKVNSCLYFAQFRFVAISVFDSLSKKRDKVNFNNNFVVSYMKGIGKVTHRTVNFGHLRFKIFVSLQTTFCFNLILSNIQTQNYLHLCQLNVKLWFNFKSELMSLLCSVYSRVSNKRVHLLSVFSWNSGVT